MIPLLFVFRELGWRRRDGLFRPRRHAVEQYGGPGKGRPQHRQFDQVAIDDPRYGQGDPDTETIKAIEQMAKKSVAGRTTDTNADVPRAILGLKEMGEAP